MNSPYEQFNEPQREVAKHALKRLGRELSAVNFDDVVNAVQAKTFAYEALKTLSEKDRVHFALKIILGSRDTRNAGAIDFAAKRVAEHAEILRKDARARGSV